MQLRALNGSKYGMFMTGYRIITRETPLALYKVSDVGDWSVVSKAFLLTQPPPPPIWSSTGSYSRVFRYHPQDGRAFFII